MKKKTYAEQLKDPRWQKKRLKILERDYFMCTICLDDETTLHVHHLKYNKIAPWDIDDKYLTTLCEHCHENIEALKKEYGKEFNYKKVKHYKSTGWIKGGRVMFSSISGHLSMRMFDIDGEYIVGYNFNRDLKDIRRLINNALKNG